MNGDMILLATVLGGFLYIVHASSDSIAWIMLRCTVHVYLTASLFYRDVAPTSTGEAEEHCTVQSSVTA